MGGHVGGRNWRSMDGGGGYGEVRGGDGNGEGKVWLLI